jgi:hypothetical protein
VVQYIARDEIVKDSLRFDLLPGAKLLFHEFEVAQCFLGLELQFLKLVQGRRVVRKCNLGLEHAYLCMSDQPNYRPAKRERRRAQSS